MTPEDLLRVARETVAEVTWCFVITAAAHGGTSARLVQVGRPDQDWAVRFMTDRRCRKVAELRQDPRMTLAYQHEAARAYLTLTGRAELIDDVAAKRSIWRPETYAWHPTGPEDPNNQLVHVIADRIEIYSGAAEIRPEPRGFSAATLTRSGSGWIYAPSSGW